MGHGKITSQPDMIRVNVVQFYRSKGGSRRHQLKALAKKNPELAAKIRKALRGW